MTLEPRILRKEIKQSIKKCIRRNQIEKNISTSSNIANDFK